MSEKGKRMLGERLNALCHRRGKSWYMVSAESGVPLTTLLHIRDGSTKNPGIFTVLAICAALDADLSEVVEGLYPAEDDD